jgi:hypothetical protein
MSHSRLVTFHFTTSYHDPCVLQRVERELQEKGPSQLLLSSPLPEGSTTAQFAPLGMAAVPGVSVSTATLVPGVQPLGLNIDLASQSIATQGMKLLSLFTASI